MSPPQAVLSRLRMSSAEADTRAPLDERYRILGDIGPTLTRMLSPDELYTTIYVRRFGLYLLSASTSPCMTRRPITPP